MAETGSSGGGGGGWSPFHAYSYAEMTEMAYADNPKTLRKHAGEWAALSRDLYTFNDMLHEEIGVLDQVYSSAAGAPALVRALAEEAQGLSKAAAKAQRNAQALEVAADALETAQKELQGIEPEPNPDGLTWRDPSVRGPMAQKAVPVMDKLSAAFDYSKNDLEFAPTEDTYGDYAPGGGSPVGASDLSAYVYSPSATGPGGFVPPPGTGLSGHSATGRGLARNQPSGSQPPTAGGSPAAPGRMAGFPGTGTGAGRGTPSAGSAGSGGTTSGKRVRLPGSRSGAPIGGYRPIGGAPVSGGGAPPGGSSPGQAGGGPGGPGRPGMASPAGGAGTGAVPPTGHGAAPGGRDSRQRRTKYETADADTFRDSRHRTKPVIGEQRRQPDRFQATPGAIGAGNKQEGDETTPRMPELPTVEAPKRFEGHDMSVSFNRRPRAGA